MKKFLTIILVALSTTLFAQTHSSDVIPKKTEISPNYPGGQAELMNFVINKLQYPKEAKKQNVEGKVYAQFTVKEDGSLTDIEIVRGIGYGCDKEVIRIIESMPNWEPGTKDGQPIKTKMTLPVVFKLD